MPSPAKLSFLIVLLALSLAACSKKAEKPRPRPAALVLTAPAGRQDVPVQLKAIGTAEASESVVIKTQISGELMRVSFREGQDVQKGALLFHLDPRPYQAGLKKAEAALARDRVVAENARVTYERYRGLVKEGIVTQEQADGYRTAADSAATAVAADQAEVDSARTQLSYCTIKAPISGRLGVLAVDRGNVVKANETALVTINTITPIRVSFTIPEKELAGVKQHMAAGRLVVEAEVPGPAGFSETGFVTFIDNAVDPATAMIRLKADFANPRKRLWPGQFVNLTITLSVNKDAVVVPAQAVQTGQKGQYVFVVKQDGTAEMRPVKVGPTHLGKTMIQEGMQPGEQVVVDGQMRVIPGGRVEIRQPDKPGAVQKK